MSNQHLSFAMNPTKSGPVASSSFYHHTTSAGGNTSEKAEDFIPLIIVPVLIITCICCSLVYLIKKYKVCRRRSVVFHETSDVPDTEITDDRGTHNDRHINKENDKDVVCEFSL